MEHVVFYQSSQGTPAFRRVSSLEDAVSFAEHLRNVESVTDFSVYALSPVTLSLRAYYHVEVTADGAQPAPPTEPAATAPAASTPPTAEPAATPPAPSAMPDTEPAVPTAAAEPAFVAGPITGSALPDTGTGSALPDVSPEPTVIDPTVVDPTVEEVVPAGRRSMSFFARP
jgi:hypothetical protein